MYFRRNVLVLVLQGFFLTINQVIVEARQGKGKKVCLKMKQDEHANMFTQYVPVPAV